MRPAHTRNPARGPRPFPRPPGNGPRCRPGRSAGYSAGPARQDRVAAAVMMSGRRGPLSRGRCAAPSPSGPWDPGTAAGGPISPVGRDGTSWPPGVPEPGRRLAHDPGAPGGPRSLIPGRRPPLAGPRRSRPSAGRDRVSRSELASPPAGRSLVRRGPSPRKVRAPGPRWSQHEAAASWSPVADGWPDRRRLLQCGRSVGRPGRGPSPVDGRAVRRLQSAAGGCGPRRSMRGPSPDSRRLRGTPVRRGPLPIDGRVVRGLQSPAGGRGPGDLHRHPTAARNGGLPPAAGGRAARRFSPCRAVQTRGRDPGDDGRRGRSAAGVRGARREPSPAAPSRPAPPRAGSGLCRHDFAVPARHD